MQNTRHRWLAAAQGATWFQLTRHDDPEPTEPPSTEPPPVTETEPDSEPDPDGADQLGDKGKQALDRMKADKAEAKKTAAAEKKRADDLARKVAEFEDRDKSELEKAQAKAEKDAERADKATKRAVLAEVRALAADLFADTDDARVNLAEKLASYADDSGDIDIDAIAADLAEVLERKPHLSKPVEELKRKAPKPDPGQGARPAETPTDYRTASREDLEAELAQSVPGFRLRA